MTHTARPSARAIHVYLARFSGERCAAFLSPCCDAMRFLGLRSVSVGAWAGRQAPGIGHCRRSRLSSFECRCALIAGHSSEHPSECVCLPDSQNLIFPRMPSKAELITSSPTQNDGSGQVLVPITASCLFSPDPDFKAYTVPLAFDLRYTWTVRASLTLACPATLSRMITDRLTCRLPEY